VIVFPKTFAATAESWRPDAVVLVSGTITLRNDDLKLAADAVEEFAPSDDDLNHRASLLRIRVARGKSDSIELARLDQVLTALNRFPGDDRYELLVRNGRWEARLTLTSSGQGVRVCPELMTRLEVILGPNTVESVMLAALA
jgi:hypothetical protein